MSTQNPDLRTAAQAVIDRWETPLWKDAPATAEYIARLRDALADSVQEDAALTQAARDVLAERQRQITAEGNAPAHDDEHVNDEIAAMACYYVMPPGAREWSGPDGYGATLGDAIRPEGWDAKDCDRRRELVKGAALALAELERLDRADARAAKLAQEGKSHG